jgi:anti-anti-sigma regulatory factor
MHMLEMAPGWSLDLERGPDWLMVRLHCDQKHAWDTPPLAETLWALAQQHFVHRLVVEFDEVPMLHTALIGQLVMLHKRLSVNGGVLRLSGLSEQSRDVLSTARLDGRLPAFENRTEAVLGHAIVNKPR